MSAPVIPRELYTAAQVRELDRRAMEQENIPGIVLMRRAATVLLRVLQRRWEGARRLVILAGTGNNGGDGYLLAVLARAEGLQVTVLEVGAVERLGGDALLARQEALQVGVECFPYDEELLRDRTGAGATVLVDALLGTGFQGELRPAHAQAIAGINRLHQRGLPVLAVDIPSGLSCDTGVASTPAVDADVTVTFIGMKRGLFTADGPECAGDIVFSRLNVSAPEPDRAVRQPAVCRIDIHSVAPLLALRALGAHKGHCGHVLVVGGDTGYGGAAIMAAEAACRAGAGTVSLVTRSAHVAPMLARRPEVMVKGMDTLDAGSQEAFTELLASAAVVVLGPGLGRSSWSREMLSATLRCAGDGRPLVVDADGLNLLAERRATPGAGTRPDDGIFGMRKQWVLTPHPGEAARLLGITTAEVQRDRFAAVAKLQAQWGGVCLLKGLGSLVCYPLGKSGSGSDIGTDVGTDICTEGNPGMATGGMGDVLSGMIGGFIAQGLTLADSLRLAVCVHGESADLAAEQRGERGLLATDILEYMGTLINQQRHPRTLTGGPRD